jgi:hypothetical protein
MPQGQRPRPIIGGHTPVTSLPSWIIAALDVHNQYRVVTVLAAFLPTVSLSALSTFKFSPRADWHFARVLALEEILGRTEDESEDLAKIKKDERAMERRLNERWPPFGFLPGIAHHDSQRKT